MPTMILPPATVTMTVGIDEAGRGALAGPVVAGACILAKRRSFPVPIGDSKKMTPEDRALSYEWLMTNCVCGVGIVSASVIDRIGIMAATERAMQQAVQEVAVHSRDLYLLVDGRDAFWFDFPHSSIVRGDESEPCIGAASILAKVTRDRLMVEAHAGFSNYGFDQHKGYGTPEHFDAIKKHGLSSMHRRSFLRNI